MIKFITNFTILLALTPIFFNAGAQTRQQGFVMEYRGKEKKMPLPAVSIDIKYANSTVSDRKGRFELFFPTRKPGEKIEYRRIEKTGYELFNKEALDQWNINPEEPFTIIMCRSDRFKELCDLYSSNSSQSYRRQFERERNEISRLREEGKLKEAEYYKALRATEEFYEKQLDNLQNYVDRFARIDLSELSDDERSIIKLVQEGKMEEAIEKYERLNIVDKLIDNIARRKQVNSSIGKLTKLEKSLAKSEANLYDMAERQIQTLLSAGGKDNNKKILEICTRIAEADSTNTTWLMKTGRFIKENLANYKLSSEYFQKVIQAESIDSLQKASALFELGDIAIKRSSLSEAAELLSHALGIQETYGNELAKDRALTINSIGLLYYAKGEYKKAIDNFQKALAIWHSTLPVTHRHIASCYNQLGMALLSTTRYEEALICFNKALDIYEELNLADSPHVAIVVNNIGSLHRAKGEFALAKEQYQKALEMTVKWYGDEHPNVATAYNNLASVCNSLGDKSSAMSYNLTALDLLTRLYGKVHPKVAVSHHNIAGMLLGEKKYSEALVHFTDALSTLELIYSEKHPSVATAHGGIGLLYIEMADFASASEHLQKALAINQTLHGEAHPEVGVAYNNLARLSLAQGNHIQASELYQKALNILQNHYGKNHPRVSAVYQNMGKNYRCLNDATNARRCYQEALTITAQLSGVDHPNTLAIKNILDTL